MIIAYCFIGSLPDYAVDTVYQTRLFYHGPIYFIISDTASPYVKQLELYNVTIIPYFSVLHRDFTECTTKYNSKFEVVHYLTGREKLFLYSFERFAVLYQLMKTHNLSNVFFLELDNLIYDDPLKWEEQFATKEIAYMYDKVDRCCSGICFIKNAEILDKLVQHFIHFIGNTIKPVTEMIALYEFWQQNTDLVQILPTHWPTIQTAVSQEFDRYCNTVFDSAPMGVLLGGMDPFHTGGVIKKGLYWISNDIDYTKYTYEWRPDHIGRNIPYVCDNDNQWRRINNLHIHSKDLRSNLSVPRTIRKEGHMKRHVQLIFLPELNPLPVMKCVFQELAGAFRDYNAPVREITQMDELIDGGIAFLDDVSGNYKEKQMIYEEIAQRCPTTVFICWYWWADVSFRPFTYMIHTGEYFRYLEEIKMQNNAYDYMKLPFFIPLKLHANDSPDKIGTYSRSNQIDYCFMGGNYKFEWVKYITTHCPQEFIGFYHSVVYDNYLTYDHRRQIYLSSTFALGFQSNENIKTGHLSQRIFEGLAYGCIVLCENPLASEVTNGIVVHVSSQEDLVEKMRYYKAHPELIAEKQQQGYNWIQQHGTNRHSIRLFLQYIDQHIGLTFEPTVSVNIMGGLGNQMFQIATAYAYAKKTSGQLQIIRKHDNGNRPLYWDTIFKKLGSYLVESVPSTLEQWYEDRPTMYKDIGPLTESGKYIGGYLQTSKYFAECKEEIRTLFTFDDSVKVRYGWLLANKDRVVVMHCRQTDYLSAKDIHGPLTHDYYRRAIQRMNERIADPIYLLCGDDMTFWMKESLPLSSTIMLLNETEHSTIALLQQFHNFIMSNSTFNWWCVWLADARNVIVPQTWFGPAGPHPYDDIYEPLWDKL